MAKDIVCGMEVDSPSPWQSTYQRNTFEFCSKKCKNEFDENPETFVSGKGKAEATYDITSNGVQKLQLPIVDMSCASCAVTIEKEIRRLPGVQKAVVNGATEKAYVEFDRSETTVTQIIEAIKKSGYKAGYARSGWGW